MRHARLKAEGGQEARAEPTQHGIAFGCGDEDVLICDVSDGPDSRQGVIELFNPTSRSTTATPSSPVSCACLSAAIVRRNNSSAFATSRLVVWKRRSSRFCALLNSEPMYFSNMASAASASRVPRSAICATRIAVRRAGSRSAMCCTLMMAPSSRSRLRRAGWIRLARAASMPRPRTYSSRSRRAIMLEGPGDLG